MFNNFVAGNVASGLNVTPAASPNMTLLIQPGSGLIREGSNPGQISYHVINDTSAGESVTVSTANASNPRNDYVVGYIDKAVTPTGTNNTNVYKYAVVAGTPSATPADPTVGQIQAAIGAANPYHILGRVRVATSTTVLTNSVIDDLRTMLTVGAANIGGSAIALGYAQITSAFSSSSTSATDVTGLSVTVTTPGNRRIEISTWFGSMTAAGGNNAANVLLLEGSTVIASSRANVASGNNTPVVPPSASRTPAAGTYTYKVQLTNDLATATAIVASSTSPAYILVKAI